MTGRRVAVIDVGSNSTNLLVLDGDGALVVRKGATTRLGEGLATSGILSQAAIARTVDAISSHVESARANGADIVRIVGTAACRRAGNTDELAGAIAGRTGLGLSVLAEADEAAMAFEGALSGLPAADVPTLVLDIGGGSTEFAFGVRETEFAASIPWGAVTATESHFSSDPPPPEDLTNLIGAVADDVDDVVRAHPALATPGRVVGVAGTIVTIARVEAGMATKDAAVLHGMRLTRDAAEDVFRTLATEGPAERILNPGMSRDRNDIIVAGCCILVAVLRRLSLDGLDVSTRGLMFGVAERERLLP